MAHDIRCSQVSIPGKGLKLPVCKQDNVPDDAKLYVAHLGPSMGDEDLRQLFEPFGQVVSTRVIFDRETGVSKGAWITARSSRTGLLLK